MHTRHGAFAASGWACPMLLAPPRLQDPFVAVDCPWVLTHVFFILEINTSGSRDLW